MRIYDEAGGRWGHREFLLRSLGATPFSWFLIPPAHSLPCQGEGGVISLHSDPQPRRRVDETKCGRLGRQIHSGHL